MLKHIIIIATLLFSISAHSESFNIYVTYEDDKLKNAIYELIQQPAVENVLIKYKIKPFILNYPLHNTLYLAEFESYSIPYVIETLQMTVKRWSGFRVKLGDIVVSPSGYVMWDLLDTTKIGDQNPKIQQYSDEVVMNLYQTRDTFAKPPEWIKNNPIKMRAFKRYGSPNVFFELSPHFTLMAKSFDNEQTAQAFMNDIKAAISQYPIKKITLKANAIGLGVVNEYGQITREIVRFNLQ